MKRGFDVIVKSIRGFLRPKFRQHWNQMPRVFLTTVFLIPVFTAIGKEKYTNTMVVVGRHEFDSRVDQAGTVSSLNVLNQIVSLS